MNMLVMSRFIKDRGFSSGISGQSLATLLALALLILLPVILLFASGMQATATTPVPPPPVLGLGDANRINDIAIVNFVSDGWGVFYYQLDGITPASAAALISKGISVPKELNNGYNSFTIRNLTTEVHTVYIAATSSGDNVSNLLVITIPQAYTLSVEGCSITAVGGTAQESGTVTGNYSAGTHIHIDANPPPAECVFDKWTSSGDKLAIPTGVVFNFVFVMPAEDVAITANWKSTASSITTQTTDSDSGGDNGASSIWILLAGGILLIAVLAISFLARSRKYN